MSDVLFFAMKKLSNVENARLDAEVLLSVILKVNRSYLRTHEEEKLSRLNQWRYFYCISKRSQNIPVHYIMGQKKWCGMSIEVTPSVLIPRDETEILLQKIFQEDNNPQTILDIGTGSGCISLALAKKYIKSKITALDNSRAALSVAKKNFRNHDVTINLQYSDLLSTIPKDSEWDIIVANLPYVPVSHVVTQSVQKEPIEAIFSGEDGLDLLRRLAKELEQKKIQFGVLWLEFLPQQWDEIKNIFNMWRVIPVQDLNGDIYFAKITPR